MATTPHVTLAFAGIREAPADSPPGLDVYDPDDPDSIDTLSEQVKVLQRRYRSVGRPLFYLDEDTDEVVHIEAHKAMINPAWEGDGLADAPKADACWTPASQRYDAVNPADAWGPLQAAALSEGVGAEEDAPFGALYGYRNGGEVHMDAFFPHYRTTVAQREFIIGIQTGYSHYADQALYARPIALDTETGAVYRDLDDARTRRHVKGEEEDEGQVASEVAAWWVKEFARLDRVTDALLETIVEARDYVVDFDGHPFGPEDLYTALGFAEDHAEFAAELVDSAGATQFTAWELYEAIALTLTERFEGKMDGGALRRHTRRANDILFRPPTAEADALREWRRRTVQDDLEDEDLPSRLAKMEDNALAAADRYRSIKDRLKDMMEEARKAEEADAEEVAA